MPEKSRLMPISYYNPKQEIRLSAYADTIVLEPDGREQRLRAIRFGGYPEMVRAMSDAIYAGATLETEFAGEPAMLACEPKKYECHLSHDGIYAEATILSLDDADTAAKKDEDTQADGQTNVELPPRKCILFCPAGDRQALFEALDRKTSVPLIPEFQNYVLDELQRRRFLKPLRVISIRERLEAWLLLCKKDDANIVKVLEDGLKSGAIRIPGTVQNLNGFDSVHSVTSYLSAFGVTVAERIRNQFQPLFDPAAEQLSPELHPRARGLQPVSGAACGCGIGQAQALGGKVCVHRGRVRKRQDEDRRNGTGRVSGAETEKDVQYHPLPVARRKEVGARNCRNAAGHRRSHRPQHYRAGQPVRTVRAGRQKYLRRHQQGKGQRRLYAPPGGSV